jgi:uncharacterized membrane protein YraQ (UPF0718 family)
MAFRPDVEANTKPDERAPLLANESSRHDAEAQPVDNEAEPDKPAVVARNWQWYAWRGFWAVLIILVLAVFIKGWVNSEDVDVSSLLPAVY